LLISAPTASAEFWQFALGEDTSTDEDPAFVMGFADGLLALWDEVKDHL
jgi:hypothetical protein